MLGVVAESQVACKQKIELNVRFCSFATGETQQKSGKWQPLLAWEHFWMHKQVVSVGVRASNHGLAHSRKATKPDIRTFESVACVSFLILKEIKPTVSVVLFGTFVFTTECVDREIRQRKSRGSVHREGQKGDCQISLIQFNQKSQTRRVC